MKAGWEVNRRKQNVSGRRIKDARGMNVSKYAINFHHWRLAYAGQNFPSNYPLKCWAIKSPAKTFCQSLESLCDCTKSREKVKGPDSDADERRLLKNASESLRPEHSVPEALDCSTHQWLERSGEMLRARSRRGCTSWQRSYKYRRWDATKSRRQKTNVLVVGTPNTRRIQENQEKWRHEPDCRWLIFYSLEACHSAPK